MSRDNIIVRVDYRGGRASRNRSSGGIGPIRFRDRGVRSCRRVPYSRARDIAHQRDHGGLNEGRTLFLSALESDLSGDDIEEIYGRFGRVQEVTLHYDRSGVPLGTATVTFERRAAAVAAIQHANDIRPADWPPTSHILSAPPDSRGTGQNTRSSARREGRGLRGERRERIEPTTNPRTPTVQEELDAAELDACVHEREVLRNRRRRRWWFSEREQGDEEEEDEEV